MLSALLAGHDLKVVGTRALRIARSPRETVPEDVDTLASLDRQPTYLIGVDLGRKHAVDGVVALREVAPCIDVRGTGGHLVGPGSLTPFGTYRVVPHRTSAVQPVPAALLRLLVPQAAPQRSRDAPATGSGTSSHPAGAPAGAS
ncbi:hypothetical protein ABZU86_13945 [Streptomyces sp. NPDC005271]|uniref:hypothetical protein n=1 Tax=unclassified Streptomyces TaxID=2593676 RepID=UPI00339E7B43